MNKRRRKKSRRGLIKMRSSQSDDIIRAYFRSKMGRQDMEDLMLDLAVEIGIPTRLLSSVKRWGI